LWRPTLGPVCNCSTCTHPACHGTLTHATSPTSSMLSSTGSSHSLPFTFSGMCVAGPLKYADGRIAGLSYAPSQLFNALHPVLNVFDLMVYALTVGLRDDALRRSRSPVLVPEDALRLVGCLLAAAGRQRQRQAGSGVVGCPYKLVGLAMAALNCLTPDPNRARGGGAGGPIDRAAGGGGGGSGLDLFSVFLRAQRAMLRQMRRDTVSPGGPSLQGSEGSQQPADPATRWGDLLTATQACKAGCCHLEEWHKHGQGESSLPGVPFDATITLTPLHPPPSSCPSTYTHGLMHRIPRPSSPIQLLPQCPDPPRPDTCLRVRRGSGEPGRVAPPGRPLGPMLGAGPRANAWQLCSRQPRRAGMPLFASFPLSSPAAHHGGKAPESVRGLSSQPVGSWARLVPHAPACQTPCLVEPLPHRRAFAWRRSWPTRPSPAPRVRCWKWRASRPAWRSGRSPARCAACP
jgi:hypothetical protein